MQLSTLKLLEDIRRAAEELVALRSRHAPLELAPRTMTRSAAERLLEMLGHALDHLGRRDPRNAARLPDARIFTDLTARLAPLRSPIPAEELEAALARVPNLLHAARELLAEGERDPEVPPAGRTIAPLVSARTRELHELCRRFRVQRLELFGSATSDQFDSQRSDVDLLVEFESTAAGGFAAYFGFQQALEQLFGRNVDLVEWDAIENRFFRKAIEAQKILLYAA